MVPYLLMWRRGHIFKDGTVGNMKGLLPFLLFFCQTISCRRRNGDCISPWNLPKFTLKKQFCSPEIWTDCMILKSPELGGSSYSQLDKMSYLSLSSSGRVGCKCSTSATIQDIRPEEMSFCPGSQKLANCGGAAHPDKYALLQKEGLGTPPSESYFPTANLAKYWPVLLS